MIPESLWLNSILAIASFVFAFFMIFFFGYLQAKKKEIKPRPRRISAFIVKYSIGFGLVFIIIGAAFLIPILNSSESIFLFELTKIEHEFQPPSHLIPNGYYWGSEVPPYVLALNRAYFNFRYFGFLLLGFLLLIMGMIIFSKIFQRQKKHSKSKIIKLTSKRGIALASIAVLFLFLFGYFMYLNYLDYEWTIDGWSFGRFDFFSNSIDGIFFTSLLIVYLFVLPLVIFKIKFLDNSPNEPQAIIENEPIAKEKHNSSIGFIAFLKNGYISIKNYILPVGFILVILGGCLIVLPSRFFIDSYPDFILETKEVSIDVIIKPGYVFVEYYYGLIRGQLFLVGFSLLVFGFILIIRYIFETMTMEQKLKAKKILVFLNKYSPVFGVVFVIIGAIFLITTLIKYGVNIIWVDWYIKNYFWHLRIPLLLTGFLLLIIGLISIIRYIRHNLRSKPKQ